MLISVIIPVYNVEKYIEQCLESVINQSFKDLEIICVNDCSTDNSPYILKKYASLDNRIVIKNNKENIGLGYTRNEGFKISHGDFIHFLDSDDWLEPDAYKRLAEKTEKYNFLPEVIVFKYKIFNQKNKRFEYANFKNNNIFDKNLNPLVDIGAIDNWDRYAWQKLYKRSFLEENNIYYNNYRCFEDIEQAALVYTKCKSMCFVDEYILNYRTERKKSLVSNHYKHLQTVIDSYNTNKKVYENLPSDIKQRLLGFDFYMLRKSIINTYIKRHLSYKEMIELFKEYDTKEVENYIYTNLPHYLKSLRIQKSDIIKAVIKRYFPTFTRIYSNFKDK